MNRKDTKESIENLIQKIRKLNKFVAIRSTFMVGFPGEKRKHFKQLKQFISEYKLNNVGFFDYSREEFTRSYKMKGQVHGFIKKLRLKEIQKVQKQILLKNQQNFVGRTIACVCDEKLDDNLYKFRSEYNSPDVDTYVYVYSQNELKVHEFYNIKITNVLNEDLQGEIVWIYQTEFH